MEPWIGSRDPGGDRGINVNPNTPFYLMHHPHSWQLVYGSDGVAEWLPQLSKLVEDPGVQGVRSIPGGGVDSSLARTEAQDRGCLILPRELGYLTRHKTRSGGYYYAGIWVRAKEIAGKVIWKPDTEQYNEFRRNLLREQIIAPPDPDVLEMQVEREERRIERLIREQHLPEVKKRLEASRDTIRDMGTATAAITAPPKKRRRKAAP